MQMETNPRPVIGLEKTMRTGPCRLTIIRISCNKPAARVSLLSITDMRDMELLQILWTWQHILPQIGCAMITDGLSIGRLAMKTMAPGKLVTGSISRKIKMDNPR